MLREALDDLLRAKDLPADPHRRTTLRLIKAAIDDRDATAREHGSDPVGDREVLSLIQSLLQQRRQALQGYRERRNAHLLAYTQEEISILEDLLNQLTSAEATRRPHLRTTREVIEDHVALRRNGRLEEDLQRNYARNVVLLTSNSCLVGHDALRASAARLREQLPGVQFQFPALQVHGDYALLIWQARSDGDQVHCGADSFVVRNGLIRLQTVHYCLIGPDGEPRRP